MKVLEKIMATLLGSLMPLMPVIAVVLFLVYFLKTKLPLNSLFVSNDKLSDNDLNEIFKADKHSGSLGFNPKQSARSLNNALSFFAVQYKVVSDIVDKLTPEQFRLVHFQYVKDFHIHLDSHFSDKLGFPNHGAFFHGSLIEKINKKYKDSGLSDVIIS